jgi:Zinc carboxypeptidase
MAKLFFILLATLFTTGSLYAQPQHLTRFEKTNGQETSEYQELISWWKISLQEKGTSDAGYPLHLAIISNQGYTQLQRARQDNKRIILVNNGIHPGEPDGIDASQLLARDIAFGKIVLPSNVVLAIIPVYNIGGCLNRSKNYRVDQEGPNEFGSRGNSQNLDLNRDFIKCDSKEALSFASIFQECDPDVFVDNHVSNGADYQHVMTLLTTQHSKLGGAMGDYLSNVFEPEIYEDMKKRGYDLIPYVNSWRDKPENGWTEYWDSPRYASGYATLFHSFAFVPETHMLKPYPQRVDATYQLMKSFIQFTAKNSDEIKRLRAQAKKTATTANSFPLRWKSDQSSFKEYEFKGYESGYKNSEVSGLPRLFYDRNKPFTKTVKIFEKFTPTLVVEKPSAYLIPQGWWKVIERLKANKVQMTPLKKDTTVTVEWYRIEDYKTSPRQYEMHHINSEVIVSKQKSILRFRKGDWYIPMNQEANRFLMETLEPQGEDSYFAWNFFDAILGQKEGYSAYVFEDKAAEYLKQQPALKTQLEQRRANDTSFAKSARAQLDFIFKNSPWYEPDHNRYPVFRVL